MPFNIKDTDLSPMHNGVQNNHLRGRKFSGIERKIHAHTRRRELPKYVKNPGKHASRRT